MARSAILIKNARVNLGGPNRAPYATALVANLQKDSRDSQVLMQQLKGRGREASDLPLLYRVRIDAFTDGTMPKVDDTVFVSYSKTNRALTGWYVMWAEPEQTAGALPTQILSIRKEFLGR